MRLPFRFLAPCLLPLLLAVPLRATPVNHAGENLKNKDFRNENFNGANFEGAHLEFANLTNATCKNANFRGAILTNANLSQAVLEGADFTGAKLEGATLHDARLRDAKLPKVRIHLAGAVVPDFSKVDDFRARQTLMENVERNSGALSFEYADLRGAAVLGNAEGVDFRYANLQGTNFSQTENLDKARLKGAKFDAETRWAINPVAVGAVLTPGAAAPNTAAQGNPPAAAGPVSPVVGRWIILKGEPGVTENGVLNVNADGSYEWGYSANAPWVNGSWVPDGTRARLRNGELDREWTVTVKSKDELLLESGQDGRVAVRNPGP